MLRFFADGLLVAVLLVSVVAGVWWIVKARPNMKQVIPHILMAGLSALLAGKLMSFWQPTSERPFESLGVEAGAAYMNNPGFPSDHALLATVVVMTLFVLTPYKKLSVGLIGAVLLMCIARVVALVHTPVDVVGGVVAGLVGTLWYIGLRPGNRKDYTI